jgi:competence protein ComEC
VPVAIALTAGIVADRYAGIPWPVSLAAALGFLAASAATCMGRQRLLSLLYFAGAVAASGAAYHHCYRNVYPADDIGEFATPEPRPVKLRGTLVEEPTVSLHPKNDPLQSFERPDPTRAVLQVSHLHNRRDWLPVSGRAQLVAIGELKDLHVGDEVEVVGRLIKPQPPANPGEFDYASFLLDQRIRAIVRVRTTVDPKRPGPKTSEAVRRLSPGAPWSVARALPLIRGWGQQTLQDALPPQQAGVAVALLLGEGSLMTGQDWAKYIKTGVIHVLAISGQHLVVLAAFLWLALRALRLRRRRGALLVGLFLLGYSLLAGGRPPVMRSAVMICTLCLGLMLRRPVMPANSFALAWILVAVLNPTDLFNSGCLLSFLSVAVLSWGTRNWLEPADDPLELLVDETRPQWLRLLRYLGRVVLVNYGITLAIWLALIPLVAARYQMVSFVGLLLGPPLVLLTSVALITGFLLLLADVLFWPLVPVLALPTTWSVAGCEFLVDAALTLPGAYCYVGDIPDWWLWVYYAAFLAVLMLESLRRHWRWAILAGLGWLCIGLFSGWTRTTADELRCTFLAVGKGGCTVLETPDGRTLLYDAGAVNGPEVTRRQIAPFLWSRGIRRIDELFLSHADLDHFNGLKDLLDRFAVGQVTCTPTFDKKTTDGVKVTLAAIKEHGVPVRIVRAGDRLAAGEVGLRVLHPPPRGPEGRENFRSMVLLVRHEGHTILLTGDLEGPGMEQVLALPPFRVDVLMAPHHGSRAANTPALVKKVRPQIVIASLGPPQGATRPPDPKMVGGVPFWGTWPNGAITIRSRPGRLTVETFLTGQRLLLDSRPRR